MTDAAPRPNATSTYVPTTEMPWRPFGEAPGVDLKVLKRHPPSGGATFMLWLGPGTHYRAHRHTEGEA